MLHLFFLNVLDIDDVQVPPWWIANDYPCWEMIVDRWCSQEWLEMHEAARQRRLLMPVHRTIRATVTSRRTRLDMYVN